MELSYLKILAHYLEKSGLLNVFLFDRSLLVQEETVALKDYVMLENRPYT